MDILDYQAECGLIRYPFQDGATLVWTSGASTGTLPNNIVLDIVLTGYFSSFLLNTIVFNGVTCVFNFSHSFSFTATDLGGICTFTAYASSGTLRVDIDTDQLYNYLNSLALIGTLTFDSTCTVCASCIRLLPPTITQIQFQNTTQPVWTETDQTSPSQTTISTITSGGINMLQGSNVQLTPINYSVTVDVLPGKGEGLYDGCATPIPAITTINNQAPTSTGAYFLENDNCFTLIPGTNSLTLNNNCIATCAQQNLLNLANYTNRITDATIQLNSYVEEVVAQYSNMAAIYSGLQTNPQSPYILSQSNQFANAVYKYGSLTCGIYNPGPTPVTLSLNFNYSSFYSIVPNTFYITLDGENVPQPTPSNTLLNNVVVDCASISYLGLVLQTSISQLNYGGLDNDVSFQLSNSANQISGCGLAMNPLSFNFNYTYTILYSSTNITINLTLELLDPNQPTSSATTMQFNMPGYFTVMNNTITSNNIPSNMPISDFTNVSLNYNVNNQYNLIISCPHNVVGNQAILITGSNSLSASTKTITINL